MLWVTHESRVAAIRTASGARRLLDEGLVARMEAEGARVDLVEVGTPVAGSPSEVAEAFAMAGEVSREVRAALEDGLDVVVLASSCHMGLGAVSGLTPGRRGLIWLDAHGDFNTAETSVSGLLDGMTVATITGRCWNALAGSLPGFAPVLTDAVVMVGVRELDPAEEDLLEASGVIRLPIETARSGAADVLAALGERVDSVYLHVDLDVLDPSVGRANAFATPGGFTAGDLEGFLVEAGRRCPVRALGFASYDPALDPGGGVAGAAVRAAAAWVGARREGVASR